MIVKISKGLLIVSILILILMSLLALISIHWSFITNHCLAFNPSGINNYLTAFGDYKGLFTGTIATVAAYFGIHRLKAAIDANLQKAKQDRFSDWKSVLDFRFIEIEKQAPYLKREFIKIRHKLFDKVYENQFAFENKSQLEDICNSIFTRNSITIIEQLNREYIEMGGVYLSENFSYGFDSFSFLFFGCFDFVYDEHQQDLQQFYLSQLSEKRQIDRETFEATLKDRIQSK